MSEALAAGGYGFAFLHVKAVDDTGHDRDTALKVLPLGNTPAPLAARGSSCHSSLLAAAVCALLAGGHNKA